jgi:threonylcarbamoyladenosine tRNA methylthiotransferase MtaB
VIVANTCSVTAQADRTARAFLRRVHRENPTARILVTGCYAQRAPQEVGALPGVHAVIGNSHKSLVAGDCPAGRGLCPAPAAIRPGSPLCGRHFCPLRAGHAGRRLAGECIGGGQTRPNLKVQDGCGNRCSFCIIPHHPRPQPFPVARSLSAQCAGLRRRGGTELVLSGINLGRWGRDLTPQRTLEELVSAILLRTALPRLRLSSIEPMDWTPGRCWRCL